MTMLGELVLSFVIESAILAIVWDGMAAGAAWVFGRSDRAWSVRTFVFSLIGAVAAGSLASRLGLPIGWALDIGRRELPMVWSLGGALAGAALATIRPRGQVSTTS